MGFVLKTMTSKTATPKKDLGSSARNIFDLDKKQTAEDGLGFDKHGDAWAWHGCFLDGMVVGFFLRLPSCRGMIGESS